MNVTAENNLLGIPIQGHITGVGERRVRQSPIEYLQPLLKAVHDDPGIHSFGWRQYTPYYNDGEQCVFRVGDVWFLTPEDFEDEEDRGLRKVDYYAWEKVHHYSGRKGFAESFTVWTYPEEGRPWKEDVRNPRYDRDRFQRCETFAEAVYSDKFDLALLAKFGDNAAVTITSEVITVEYYEHG